jgi:hypothetical protein
MSSIKLKPTTNFDDGSGHVVCKTDREEVCDLRHIMCSPQTSKNGADGSDWMPTVETMLSTVSFDPGVS